MSSSANPVPTLLWLRPGALPCHFQKMCKNRAPDLGTDEKPAPAARVFASDPMWTNSSEAGCGRNLAGIERVSARHEAPAAGCED